jgi:hypothetical protein
MHEDWFRQSRPIKVAAVAFAGCHDNRMDKIWWNEQWMGWPIGPQYSASSNVDNAYGAHKQYDFFVRHLLGPNPPPWNCAPAATSTQSAR